MSRVIMKPDIEYELNLLKERILKAKETNCFDDKKYSVIIKEILFREEVLEYGLQVINSIKDHLQDGEKLLGYVTSYISSLFKLKAGHKNEEKLLSEAFAKMKENDSTAWDNYNYAIERYDMDYDFSNKLILQVDTIGYVSAGLMLFISYREQIKAINK